jgi:hypothetical protein
MKILSMIQCSASAGLNLKLGIERVNLGSRSHKQDALGYPGGGGQFQPPAVVNDAELPVCNDNDNE